MKNLMDEINRQHIAEEQFSVGRKPKELIQSIAQRMTEMREKGAIQEIVGHSSLRPPNFLEKSF